MTPDDMEGRLEAFIRWLHPDNREPFSGSSLQVVSDLRALLLDYQERGRALEENASGLPYSVGDLLSYDMGGGTLIRCTYRGECEGWPMVSFDADGPDAKAVHVRPSSVCPLATLKGKSHD